MDRLLGLELARDRQLNGFTNWYDDFTFNVDDRGADYDGELNRADVWTTGGPNGSTWCYTVNPMVTAVVIN